MPTYSKQLGPFIKEYILSAITALMAQCAIPYLIMQYFNAPTWACMLMSAYTAHSQYVSGHEWITVFLGTGEYSGDALVLKGYLTVLALLRIVFIAIGVMQFIQK